MKAAQPRQSDQQPRRPAAEPDRAALAPSDAQFVDNRPEAIAQRRLADAIHNSQPAQARRRATDAIHQSPHMVAQRQQLRGMFGEAAQLQAGPEEEELLQGKFAAGQRQAGPEEEELLQGTFAPVQRQAGPEEEELLQGTFAPVQRQAGPEEEELLQGKFAPVQREEAEPDTEPRKNNTGLPDNLKANIESLSGMSMDAVRVHYNSSQPAQLNALAYAQGTDIHVAPGQEQHLPHEAWHVVQQAQGRVKPTMQMKDGVPVNGVPVNDDAGLEHEADVMGAKALAPAAQLAGRPEEEEVLQGKSTPVQRKAPEQGGTMEHTQKTPAAQQGERAAAQRSAASSAAVDSRPQAVAPRELADTGHDSPRTKAQQASIRGVLSSPRVVAQARRLDGLFGAAQLRPDPANASYRLALQGAIGNRAVASLLADRPGDQLQDAERAISNARPGTMIQAKFLADLDKQVPEGAEQRESLGPGYARILQHFIWSEPVAGNPVKKLNEFWVDLADAGDNEKQTEALEKKVEMQMEEVGKFTDKLPTIGLPEAERGWNALDDRLEKAYMGDILRNKTKKGQKQVQYPIETSPGKILDKVDWTVKRGPYGGVGSQIPACNQHYAVAPPGGLGGAPGSERIYIKAVKLADKKRGCVIWYSPGHGEKGAPVKLLNGSERDVDGMTHVSPWDPRLEDPGDAI